MFVSQFNHDIQIKIVNANSSVKHNVVLMLTVNSRDSTPFDLRVVST